MDVRGPYRIGAFFLLISGVLHVLAPIMGGGSGFMMALLVVGLVYAGMAWGLFQGWRWLAYIAFLVMLFGGIVGFGSIWSPGALPFWWWGLITLADWLGAAALFVVLWRPRGAKPAA